MKDLESINSCICLDNKTKEDLSFLEEKQEWKLYLKEIFSQKPDDSVEKVIGVKNVGEIPFFNFVKPFLQKTISEVNNKLMIYGDIIDIKLMYNILLKSMTESILHISYKILIYELNLERIEGNLKGDTHEERYDYFNNNVIGKYSDVLNIISKYTVLPKMLCESLKNTVDKFVKSIKHLLEDKCEIEEKFDFKINKIVNIEEMGDSHNKGETILKFTDEDGRSIIYKPRSLYIDLVFQEMLQFFNKNGILNKFKIMKILQKDNHGWQEYIEYKSCENIEEVNRFFQRQGQYLAIFHILNSKDFHYENIIASGENPFYIDLESLLNPAIDTKENFDNTFAVDKGENMLRNSLLKTMLLPVLYKSKIYSYDVSGLGAKESNRVKNFQIVNKHSDDMKVEETYLDLKTDKHIPSIGDIKYYAEDNIDELLKGFESCYFVILKNKDRIRENFIHKFSKATVRVILRATAVYSKFLVASVHPKYLIDLENRKRLFSLLSDSKYLRKINDFEYEALENNDIPYFWCRADEKDIYSIYGVKKNFLLKTCVDEILSKLNNLSNEDYLQQKYFIKNSLQINKCIQKEDLRSLKLLGLTDNLNVEEYNRQDFLKEAINIADKMIDTAIKGDDGSITWITVGMDGYENMNFNVLNETLYSGITGICLFYAYINKLVGDEKYLNMANACLKTILNAKGNNKKVNISAFNGKGSILYCLLNLYLLWHEEWIIDEIKKYLKIIKENIKYDSIYDFLGGCAGTISICLDVYKKLNIEEALEVAKLCGNHLVENCSVMEVGCGWKNEYQQTKPVAGLAHGNAGISYSLMKLYKYIKNEKFKNTAIEAIKYEDSLYDAIGNNWIDLRNFEENSIRQDPIAWCNGAMGIGLGRLFILDYYDSDEIRSDYNNALNKTITDSFIEVNYSLCHGDLGNIELPLSAAIKFDDKELKRKVYKKAASMIQEIKVKNNNYWKCGIPGRYETESFMIGISGIGYELLRLYNNNIPNILMLDSLNEEL